MYAERALRSEPTHFGALTSAGEVFTRLQRPEQAIPILRYAVERDPVNYYHFDNLSKAYFHAGQFALAEEVLRVMQVLEPDDDFSPWLIGLALLLQGKSSEALQQFEENLGDDHPLRWHGRALALHALGRTDEALSELARLLEAAELFEDNPDYMGIYWFIGTAYAWIGATDEAFDAFAKQREWVPWLFTSMGDSPLYANLRDDPRWHPFLVSVNVDPDFLASVEFNPRLPSEIRSRENAITR